MKYLFETCPTNADGTVTIPKDKVDRWKRQAQTLYADLSETEKESDRHQANKVLMYLDT